MKILGDPSDGSADSVLRREIARGIKKGEVVVFTQDHALGAEFRSTCRRSSARTRFAIHVLHVESNGNIVPHGNGRPHMRKPKAFRFDRPDRRAPVSGRRIQVDRLPTVGDHVMVDNGYLHLQKEIGQGGEGKVFATDQANLVCKIFHSDCLTEQRRDKLRRMLCARPPSHVCWPKSLANGYQGEFVGYTMPIAHGRPWALQMMSPETLRAVHPTWQREHLAKIGESIARTVSHLHALGVIIGDLNVSWFSVNWTNVGDWIGSRVVVGS